MKDAKDVTDAGERPVDGNEELLKIKMERNIAKKGRRLPPTPEMILSTRGKILKSPLFGGDAKDAKNVADAGERPLDFNEELVKPKTECNSAEKDRMLPPTPEMILSTRGKMLNSPSYEGNADALAGKPSEGEQRRKTKVISYRRFLAAMARLEKQNSKPPKLSKIDKLIKKRI